MGQYTISRRSLRSWSSVEWSCCGFGTAGRAPAQHLAELAGRLGRRSHSFAVGASRRTEDERAAWIEALGWCDGWDYPRRVVADPG